MATGAASIRPTALIVRVVTVLAFVVIAAFSLEGVSAAAEPNPLAAHPSAAHLVTATSDSAACAAPQTFDPSGSDYLAVNRWGSVASDFHDQLDAKFYQDLFPKLQRRGLFSTFMSGGNAMWQMTTNLVSTASRFCVIDSLGHDADALTASLGKAIANSGIMAAILIMGLIAIMWRKMRNAGTWKSALQPLLVAAIIGIMIAGASASTQTTPGAGSPWWLAARVNSVVSNVAAAPAAALTSKVSNVDDIADGNADLTSCAVYQDKLMAMYQSQTGNMDRMAAVLPAVMSRMWETTGLAAWTKAQFGAANDYGDKVACYVLESRINESRYAAALITGAKVNGTGGWGSADARPFNWNADDHLEDAAVIGLAACTFNGSKWGVSAGWSTFQADGGAHGNSITADDCKWLWTDTSDVTNRDEYRDHNMFYKDDPGYIANEASRSNQPAVGNFLLNWHGNDNGAAFVLVASYLVSALIALLVFGVMSIGIIIGKLMLVVMLAFIIFAALMSLWPSANGSRLAKYARSYLGITLAVFSVSALFGVMSIVTDYLTKAGANLFGSGSILAMLWTGFAPITAIITISMLFKHVLKAPSPFKPSGMMAWGSAVGGGGLGSAAGGGLDRMWNRTGRRMRQTVGTRLRGGIHTMSGRTGAQAGTAGRGQKMRPRDERTVPKVTPETSTESMVPTIADRTAGPDTGSGTGPETPRVGADASPEQGQATPGGTQAPAPARLARPGPGEDVPKPIVSRDRGGAKPSTETGSERATRRGTDLLRGGHRSARWAQRVVDRETNLRSRDDIRTIRLVSARAGSVGARATAVALGSRVATSLGLIARRRMQAVPASTRNQIIGATDRARDGIKWARSHPAKTGAATLGVVAGTALGAVVGSVVAGGAATAAGGAAAVLAKRRHDRKDPEAASRRRTERAALYRRAPEPTRARAGESSGDGRDRQRMRLRDAFGPDSVRPRRVAVIPSPGEKDAEPATVGRPGRAVSPGESHRAARKLGTPVGSTARGQHRPGRNDRPQITLAEVMGRTRPDPGQWGSAAPGRAAVLAAERTRSRAADKHRREARKWQIPDSWRSESRRVRRESVVATHVAPPTIGTESTRRVPAHTERQTVEVTSR